MTFCKIFCVALIFASVYISKICLIELNSKKYVDSEINNGLLETDNNLNINNADFEAFADTIECFCGNHSTKCEYKNGLKVCTCQEGYVPGNYEICREMCNDSKPCQNGGTCYDGICACPPRTKGTFCEKIDVTCWRFEDYEDYSKVRGLYCCCKKNATALCKYDIKKHNAYCECPNKGDVYEDRSNTCKECNCGKSETWTKCDFYGGVKTCFCKKNYEYNPKTGTCEYCNCGELSKKCEYTWGGLQKCTCLKGVKQYKNGCRECDCGKNGFCELRDGNPICHCSDNFQEFNGNCIKCDCGKHGKCVYDEAGKKVNCQCEEGYAENTNGECQYCYCGDNSICNITDDGTKKCNCQPGYKDINGFCTSINLCDEQDQQKYKCPPTEICKSVPGGMFCACADGYMHTSKGCEDINECAIENPCKNKGAECVNTPGGFECRCQTGYLARGGDKTNLECQKNSAANVGYGLLVTLFAIILIALSIIVFKKYRS